MLRSPGEILEGRAPAVNEDHAAENERLRNQLHRDAEALDRLRLESDELHRAREYERREAKSTLDEAIQRAENAEARVAELDGLRRERDDGQREANATLAEMRQRSEEAEARVTELEAELGEGIPGRLRALCKGVRTRVQAHWPGAGGR
jgi:nucleotide-binding universal stress UspA family protein